MIHQLSGVVRARPTAPGYLRLGPLLAGAGQTQDARSAFGQRFAESSSTMTRLWSLAAFPQSSNEYYQKQAFALTTWLMSAIDFATTILQLALTCVERKELLMRAKTRDLLTHRWQSQANLSMFLFLLVVVTFVLPSMGFEKSNLPIYADAVFSVALVVGTAIAWENRTLFALTSLVTIVTIVVRWATLWRPTNPVILWRASTGLAAILMITTILLWQVFRSGPVTAKRVQGALAAYLCLGFAWAHAYHIAALLDPGAFNSAGSDVSGVSTWVNYSFGMLTTVGYQGILPVHPVAHTLGSGEAVAGQLYLAVLVARLVSMQVSSAAKGD
jgi:hypothetical protein